MTGDSFAQEWPGQWSRGSRGHRRRGRKDWKFGGGEGGPGAWVFAREQGKGRHGRPSEEELEDLIAMRRMRGGGGPWGGGGGPWGGGGGPWGGGPRGRGRGRARRGDVRLALLRLLAEEPRNGYQLMQTIEERSDGRWRPSPGSVYPTLAQLEDEGLVRAVDQEGTQMFQIAKAAWQVAQEGDERQVEKASQTLAEARRALYGILAQDTDDPDA